MAARSREVRDAVVTAINDASLGFTAEANRIPLSKMEDMPFGEPQCYVWVSEVQLSHGDRGNRVAEITVEVGIAARVRDDVSEADATEDAMWDVIDTLEFQRVTTASYGTAPNLSSLLRAPFDTDKLRQGVFMTATGFTYRLST